MSRSTNCFGRSIASSKRAPDRRPNEGHRRSWHRCMLSSGDPVPRTQLFDVLTDREQVVLAELMEGHCAEEIANAAFVSISTIRSQIKAILQKLGVNSQLAAVAMARRAGWSLDTHPGNSPNTLRREPRPRPGVA